MASQLAPRDQRTQARARPPPRTSQAVNPLLGTGAGARWERFLAIESSPRWPRHTISNRKARARAPQPAWRRL
eukprot:scaffold162410_cov29-Tisochrysis_lutea.AAC.2